MFTYKTVKTVLSCKTFLGFIGLFFLTAPSSAELLNSDVPVGVFIYQEKVGDTVITFEWQAEETDEGVVIRVEEEGKSFFNLCRPDGATLKWRFMATGEHELTAERIGNTLSIRGVRSGKEITEDIAIDDRPWYQPLSFSLSNFINSKENKTSFWVIRPDEIDVLALTAEKVGEEILLFQGEEVLTHKVEIRAEGFYARFWHATYWYRKSDSLFMRYQSVHGLPGTDATVIELLSTPLPDRNS